MWTSSSSPALPRPSRCWICTDSSPAAHPRAPPRALHPQSYTDSSPVCHRECRRAVQSTACPRCPSSWGSRAYPFGDPRARHPPRPAVSAPPVCHPRPGLFCRGSSAATRSRAPARARSPAVSYPHRPCPDSDPYTGSSWVSRSPSPLLPRALHPRRSCTDWSAVYPRECHSARQTSPPRPLPLPRPPCSQICRDSSPAGPSQRRYDRPVLHSSALQASACRVYPTSYHSSPPLPHRPASSCTGSSLAARPHLHRPASSYTDSSPAMHSPLPLLHHHHSYTDSWLVCPQEHPAASRPQPVPRRHRDPHTLDLHNPARPPRDPSWSRCPADSQSHQSCLWECSAS